MENTGAVQEAVVNQELSILKEERDKAFNHFFEMDGTRENEVWDEIRWKTPTDIENRLESYIKAEAKYRKAEVANTKHGFNLEAEKEEAVFNNAEKYYSMREGHGKESLERVLKRLYRFQKKREEDFAKSAKRDSNKIEDRNEWTNILSCQNMVGNLADKIIGPGTGRKFHRGDSLWKDYE